MRRLPEAELEARIRHFLDRKTAAFPELALDDNFRPVERHRRALLFRLQRHGANWATETS